MRARMLCLFVQGGDTPLYSLRTKAVSAPILFPYHRAVRVDMDQDQSAKGDRIQLSRAPQGVRLREQDGTIRCGKAG
jgi:hypothetical protein